MLIFTSLKEIMIITYLRKTGIKSRNIRLFSALKNTLEHQKLQLISGIRGKGLALSVSIKNPSMKSN